MKSRATSSAELAKSAGTRQINQGKMLVPVLVTTRIASQANCLYAGLARLNR